MRLSQTQVIFQLQIGEHGEDYTAAANRPAHPEDGLAISIAESGHLSNQKRDCTQPQSRSHFIFLIRP